MLNIDHFREVDPEQDHYKYWTEPIRKRPSTRFRGAKEGYRLSKINRLIKKEREEKQRKIFACNQLLEKLKL